ncbi:9685_t:CDS:2, partial [Gigaspora rosea]
ACKVVVYDISGKAGTIRWSEASWKMERLKDMIQGDDDSVQIYTNCFDAYVKEIDEQLRDLEKRE